MVFDTARGNEMKRRMEHVNDIACFLTVKLTNK